MSEFGLIGKNIDYSFSRSYFTNKFKEEELAHTYRNFDIEFIEDFLGVIKKNKNLKGLNVTIPYKETIIPYLTRLDKTAQKIGAVNTIKFMENGELIGYNTDFYGFKKAIEPLLNSNHKKALILGTGGASKAVAYVLEELGITYNYVSRTASKKAKFTYKSITEAIISKHQLIINCTPLGTYPQTNACPPIPYDAITPSHLLFDLIYNPEESKFLTVGKLKGAKIRNGLEMLKFQAEKAWKIWQ